MKCYQILETLQQIEFEKLKNSENQYVVVLTPEEWGENSDKFDMVIDIELNYYSPHVTKAETNYDSLTGNVFIPEKKKTNEKAQSFAFALDEKGIVIIDKDNYTSNIVKSIIETKKNKMPSLERFLYDFLEKIIEDDFTVLEKYEKELNEIETDILTEKRKSRMITTRIYEIRWELLNLRAYYEQFAEFSQELEKNENNFFTPKNLRFFNLFKDRVMRLQDVVTSLRDYSVQLRELLQAQLGMKQNRIITILTVVTAVFAPLSLITSWYGMNFTNMPELDSKLGYPIVIVVSLVIVVGSLVTLRLKKWI